MPAAPKSPDENERLKALRNLRVLDTPEEPRYERLVDLAAAMVDAPMAAISLVDEDRQWFKAAKGLNSRQTPREVSLCSWAILGDVPLDVPNTKNDDRFKDNLMVCLDPKIRAYIGIPLKTRSGHKIGALCVMWDRPRESKPKEIMLLKKLASMVMDEIELGTILSCA